MKAPIAAIVLSLASSAPALAGTFVYVSNAEDGDIGMYTLQAEGSLLPGQRFKAAKLVMPMAVSPDKRFLIAAVRSKPFQAYSYSIDKSLGELNLVGTGTLAESYPYIALDRSGRFLLGASYGANQVGVNSVGGDGRISEPHQVIPTARNAHSIRTDNTNRFVFVPHLGTDQVFQFQFDETNGRLAANTPPVLQLKQGTGPRHLIVSSDNRFVYLLNELTGTVTTLALDPSAGTLKELELCVCVAPGHQARPRRTARSRRDPWREPDPAKHRQRHLGFGSSYHAERPLSLRRRAHVEHARGFPRRYHERKAHLSRKHADREAAPRFQYRPGQPLRYRIRREVGYDLFLCN